jgi:hypothetical protein
MQLLRGLFDPFPCSKKKASFLINSKMEFKKLKILKK